MGRIVHNGKHYLTVAETCEVVDLKKARVWTLIREGRLEATKLEGVRARVVSLRSIVDYLATRRMLQGLTVDDVAMAMVQFERRVRKLEHTVYRRKGIDQNDALDPEATKLLRRLESLKSHLGVS